MTDKNIPDTRITLFGNTMDNPVIPASGTFGFGYGFTEWFDISILGSIALKGTTLEARDGNPLPRIAECPAGMINAIGLQNPGAVAVRDVELKKLAAVYPKKVIANVGGHSFREYTEASRILSGAEEVFAIELNVSCPNVKGGGMAFGLDSAVLEELTAAVKEVSEKPVVVKLSPNVTDITVLAKAAETPQNTYLVMGSNQRPRVRLRPSCTALRANVFPQTQNIVMPASNAPSGMT